MSVTGKYEQVSEENWAAFMEALELPDLLQIAATIDKPTMEVIFLGVTP